MVDTLDGWGERDLLVLCSEGYSIETREIILGMGLSPEETREEAWKALEDFEITFGDYCYILTKLGF